MEKINVTIYGDYACPWVYNTATWLNMVKKVYKNDLQITWKNFSLEQNAYTIKQKREEQPATWKVWEEPDPTVGRSLLAQIAGEAARRQGPELHEKFHLALLTARHGREDRLPLNEEAGILEVAKECGLDAGRLKEDMKDPALAKKIGEDHEGAVAQGIFGTPTYVFENGNTMFLKAFFPPEADAVAEWEHFVAISSDRNYIGELKRPQPPWPKGAVD